MRLLAFLLEVPSLEAGHQYDFRDVPPGESGGGGEVGGIGTPWIIAVVVLVLVAVAVLVSLNPSKALTRLKAIAPKALILVVIATPLVVWAAFSGGDAASLSVERWTNDAGTPELIISLGAKDLNTLETTDGKRTVRVECVGRDGDLVLDAEQRWPFVDGEPGYDSPHAHQAASREQLQQADRCRLRGTRVHLEANVKGALTR
ncbi:MAG: hypothetical protein ACRDGE_04300 [Candidatus Limnocylindria bacterium]